MSPWDAKLIKPSSPGVPLAEQVQALFNQQRATWDLFRDGEAQLAGMKIKTFEKNGRCIIVQANPGRTVSTGAKVDPESVAGRPCFLCPGALPTPERGVSFGDYVLLPNPYPIWKRHMTIPCRLHVPQLFEGRIMDLLALAKALGPEMFVIYNGPRCGASAPDHMHFQACESAGVPLFDQLPADNGNDRVVPLTIWERNLLACSFKDAEQAYKRITVIIRALKDITAEPDEPMFNCIARYADGRYTLCLFPRAKHRSACK